MVFLGFDIIRLGQYFAASLCGVFVDFSILMILNAFKFPVFLANMISSFIGILTTYVVSNFIMKDTKKTKSNFTIFVLYYSLSILIFSFIIHFVANFFLIDLRLAKIILLGFSFLTNYFFASKILKFSL